MIRNQITLKQLEALVAVADMGTFRKAATGLGTTQPNVSVRIAAMEETLGVVLMHRDAGSVRLTEKGAEILAAARDVLRSTETLLDVAKRRDLIDDRLRLGVSELVASTWLHGFLRALRKNYPALRVELTVDLSFEIENRLSEGLLDLAFLSEPFRTRTTGLVPLGSSRYGWVASPDLATGLCATPDIASIYKVGILTHARHTNASKALDAFLDEQGLRPDMVVHSNSLTSCLNMAIDGMGVALLPRPLFSGPLSTDRLVEIDHSWEPDPLHFFARYDEKRAPQFVAEAAALSAKVAGDVFE